ncbi:DUF4019 domain-containing protein [Massilia sp. 9I]|uniref:DUF4019 domain-containing protein n=1 Tax=Massilia sp. 9I TaxID=2653152 RepID=UPI0012F4608D|nr:DUF4019 domain-containing protein [Massilia sp. 9I]VXB10117.1 conserved exported hypothetical protein [Massilia sp. 9I]
MKKMIATALAACVLVANPAFAQDSKALAAAHGSAQRWLKLVDKEDYSGAWDASASDVRANTPKMAWNMLLSATHLPLGQLRVRKLKSTALDAGGKRVSFEFDSEFEKDNKVLEKVTTVLDKDGAWRVTGYSVSAD